MYQVKEILYVYCTVCSDFINQQMVTSNSITFGKEHTNPETYKTSPSALVPQRWTGLLSVVSVPLQPGHTLLLGYHTPSAHCLWRHMKGNGGELPLCTSLPPLDMSPNTLRCKKMIAYPSCYNLKCSNLISAAFSVYLWTGTDADLHPWGPAS